MISSINLVLAKSFFHKTKHINVTYHRHTAASHIYGGCLNCPLRSCSHPLDSPLSYSHALRAPADSPGTRSSRRFTTWVHAFSVHSIQGGTAGDADICEAALVSLPTTPRQEQIQACREAHFRNTHTDSTLRRLERPQPCQESVHQYKQGNMLVAAHVGRHVTRALSACTCRPSTWFEEHSSCLLKMLTCYLSSTSSTAVWRQEPGPQLCEYFDGQLSNQPLVRD